MPTVNIVSRRDSSRVLYAHETTDEHAASKLATRDALEAATRARADLTGAYLARADLARANLTGACLARADLARANLTGAYLARADLAGADGSRIALIGSRPVLCIGPIGSRSDTASLWLTDAGPMVRAGCFWGSLDAFAEAVQRTHGDSVHGHEYAAAIALMRVHAEAWTPALAETEDTK